MNKIKILMVDDEKRFRDTTKKLLTKKGFETILAENGEDALSKLTMKPDVIVLDIQMPGMDGHQVLKMIKKEKPNIPVIMLTGHGGEKSAREALVEGAFDYLAKPCDIDLLTTKINEAFRLGKGAADVSEKSITDVMIPIDEYTKVFETNTIYDAITKLKESFRSQIATNSIFETGHRSVLVTDKNGEVLGILSIRDLLDAIMPSYLQAPKPSLADTIQYSPMFWSGMFAAGIKEIADIKINEIMSPAPRVVEATSSLMEAAYLMLEYDERRLLVVDGKKIIGVIREQDLFFEMEQILRNR